MLLGRVQGRERTLEHLWDGRGPDLLSYLQTQANTQSVSAT